MSFSHKPNEVNRNGKRNKNKTWTKKYSVVLAGNPNVGKSTVFNLLTGMKQHTGNWTGKTVELAQGVCRCGNCELCVTDLPGAYSMRPLSSEESVTRDFLLENSPDCVVIVADSGVLERNLMFALQVLSIHKNAVLCLNLSDEALKNGIIIDEEELSLHLGIPVVKTCATSKKGIKEFKEAVLKVCSGKTKCFRVERNFEGVDLKNPEKYSQNIKVLSAVSKKITDVCVKYQKVSLNKASRMTDKILTGKYTGIPIMLLLLGLLFWITVNGANYPSEWLSMLFSFLKEKLYSAFEFMHAPEFVTGLLIDGVYTTLAWVVSVMLPPMAIFFPLFSLIEDCGYLPRIAFNLDKFFAACGVHGKQSLTMAMGLGCNACGVTGCRIIESPKERLAAIITNNFMPCNGRFPTIIAVLLMFFTGTSLTLAGSVEVALILTGIIALCVIVTLIVCKVMSGTVLKGKPSCFALELPPYRKPQLGKVLVRSLLDRTVFVLGRAAAVAAPAGAVIWMLANLNINDVSLLNICTDFLDPFGRLLGLDGVIIMAFILGFTANETVIPIMLMCYMSNGTLVEYSSYDSLFAILSANGWSVITAVCVIILCVMHFPCSTTCLTIRKETGSALWTLVSIVLPTAIGVVLCMVTAAVMRIFIAL